jgi:hypothetical protein
MRELGIVKDSTTYLSRHVKRGCIRSNLLTNIRLLLASDPASAVVAEVSGAPQAETSVPLAIGSEAIGIVVD